MSAPIRTLPIIDAHFWVERDGEIIDTEYAHKKIVLSVNNCIDKIQYKEAPLGTQQKAIEMIERWYTQSVGEGWKDMIEKYFISLPTVERQCFQTAFVEQKLRGGRIVFGSQGWEKKDGGIHWEFGGEDWHTLNDFLKDTKRCECCFRRDNVVMGCPCGHAKYCSKECQQADWKSHKLVCKTSQTKKYYPASASIETNWKTAKTKK